MTAADMNALTDTIDLRLEEMRALAKEANDLRAVEEATKKAEREATANKQQELLANLLAAQVTESENKAARDAKLAKILGIAITVLTGGGGTLGYLALQGPTDEEKAEQVKPVTEVVNKQARQYNQRVEQAEKKIERLGDLYIEGQVQTSDEGEYTRNLIRAAHKRQTAALDNVPVPPTVTAAKTRADKVKKAKGEDKLFESADVDPFAGL